MSLWAVKTSRSLVPASLLTTETDFPGMCKVRLLPGAHLLGEWVCGLYFSEVFSPKRKKGQCHKAQLLSLWVVTHCGLSQLSVGIMNTLASGKKAFRTCNNQNWTQNQAWRESWVLPEAPTFAALCDFTVALVLNTQHTYFGLHMPPWRAWNTSAQICGYILWLALILIARINISLSW